MSFVHDTNGYVPAIISAPWQQQLLRDSPQKGRGEERAKCGKPSAYTLWLFGGV